MFKAAFCARRRIVPAAAFYERRNTGGPKQPFAFARQDGDLVAEIRDQPIRACSSRVAIGSTLFGRPIWPEKAGR